LSASPARGERFDLAVRLAGVVRSAEKRVNRLIEAGLQRSPTLARLASAVEDRRAIVYVEPRNALKARLVGAVPSLVRTFTRIPGRKDQGG
jgi:hypothetical protein